MSHEPILQWKSFPFAERPVVSVALCSFIFFLSVFIYKLAVLEWSYPIYYYGGMFLLIINLLPYFIVTEYSMYDSDIEIRYWFMRIRRSYSDFGCFYQDKRGIMLSTFKLPRRLDAFRGQSLRFSKDRSEQQALIEILTQKVGKQY